MRAEGASGPQRSRPDQAGHGPPPGRSSVPLYRLRQSPRRHRDDRLRPRSRPYPPGAAWAAGGPSTRRRRWPWATGAMWTTCGFPACCMPALRLTDHARADIAGIDTATALAAPGVVAVFTAADVPGALRVGIIHKDWPVLIPEGGRTSYLGDVSGRGGRRDPPARQQLTELVEVGYEPLPPLTDVMTALASDEAPLCGVPTATSCRARPTPGRRGCSLGRQRSRGTRGLSHPASRARLPGARVEPGRASPRRRPARLLRGPGHLGRPRPDRRRARHRPGPGQRRTGVQRRGLRR